MKSIYLSIGLTLVLIGFVSCTASYVVRERPAVVVYTRPAPPSKEYVWISGDWIWMHGKYEWREGRWERHREGYHWVDGHWKEAPHGWKWVPGHWK